MSRRLCLFVLLTLTGSEAFVDLRFRQSAVARSSLQQPGSCGTTTAGTTTTRPLRSRVLRSPSSSSRNDNNENENKAKVRFSGLDLDRPADIKQPLLDQLLAGLTTDLASITGGLLGLLLLLGGRLVLDDDSGVISVSPEALGQATRVNLLAVLATGALILNGVSKLDVVAAMAEDVVLQGARVSPPYVENRLTIATGYISWMLESLITASPAGSVVLLEATTDVDDDQVIGEASPWRPVAWAGIVPPNLSPSTIPVDTPILNRLRNAHEETYLPTLQALPGRVEFSYLPVNTQAVLLLPVTTNPRRVLALGASQARSFTPRDIAWCQVVASNVPALT